MMPDLIDTEQHHETCPVCGQPAPEIHNPFCGLDCAKAAEAMNRITVRQYATYLLDVIRRCDAGIERKKADGTTV